VRQGDKETRRRPGINDCYGLAGGRRREPARCPAFAPLRLCVSGFGARCPVPGAWYPVPGFSGLMFGAAPSVILPSVIPPHQLAPRAAPPLLAHTLGLLAHRVGLIIQALGCGKAGQVVEQGQLEGAQAGAGADR
jgi:hypothetical protein